VGKQAATWLLYSGSRIGGAEAHSLGLCDRLAATTDDVLAEARSMAVELASAAPLSVRAVRATMRRGLADRIREATELEHSEQDRLRQTEDFAEGVAASTERREPQFKGS
jgi:2-(1,2-epoxy-1,2-dihydrophenyl)acetyl-CoA isomerase